MRARAAFVAAMDDDLNTPNAVAALQKLRGEANKALEVGLSGEMRRVVRQEFRALGAVLGLLQPTPGSLKVSGRAIIRRDAEAITDTLSDEDIAGQDRRTSRRESDRRITKLADQLTSRAGVPWHYD